MPRGWGSAWGSPLPLIGPGRCSRVVVAAGAPGARRDFALKALRYLAGVQATATQGRRHPPGRLRGCAR